MFEERETCYMLNNELAPQPGDVWKSWRVGRISSSVIGAYSGRSRYEPLDTEEQNLDFASKLLGIKENNFSNEALNNMRRGTDQEPIIRDLYSNMINKPLKEVSLAIWKEDTRFSGSLDFEVINNDGTVTEGGEIKCPNKIFYKLVEFHEIRKKGFLKPDYFNDLTRNLDHIYTNYYDQMISNGVITGKKFMHYVVKTIDSNEIYWDKILVDTEHFENVLYPAACVFLDEYLEPLMEKHNIIRKEVTPEMIKSE